MSKIINNIETEIKNLIGNLSYRISENDSVVNLYCKPENFEFLENKKPQLASLDNLKNKSIKIIVECYPPKIVVSD